MRTEDKFGIRRLLLIICLITASSAVAEESDAPCSLADVNEAIEGDLTCSTSGTVFFGTDITQFVLNQCSTITNPGEESEGVNKSRAACIRCAKQTALAFQAAKKAGLLPSSSDATVSTNKIKQLCRITDDGDDDDDDQPPASDALQNMYNQIRLCFPQDGETVNVSECAECGTAVLDNALSAGVINQAKYSVMKQSIRHVCSHQDSGQPKPTPTPGGGEGGNSFEELYARLRSCFAQYHTPDNLNPEACVSCVNAIPTDGLDESKLNVIIPYARNACQGTFK